MSGFERVSILVADHDRWRRLSVASVLASVGFSVQEASNGMSALRMARAAPPDVVILGEQLPEIVATELLELLHSDARTREVAVVRLGEPASPIELVAEIVGAIDARRARPALEESRYVVAVTAPPTRSVSASARGT